MATPDDDDSLLLRLRLDQVPLHQILPLRTRVLRPHFEPDRLAHYPGFDDHPQAAHFALTDEETGEVWACASFAPEPAPWQTDSGAWRLRGMAVAPEHQGRGLGGRLLQGALPQLALTRPDLPLIWCNARTSAAPFYERGGWLTRGEVFEIPDIGPHVQMWRSMPEVVV